MPDTIARVFYLVFLQACVGGVVLLPITPRKDIMGRFFRVMGATFFCSMLLGFWAHRAAGRDDTNPFRARELQLLWLLLGGLVMYTLTAVPDRRRLNLTAWGVACAAGLGLVLLAALGDPLASENGWLAGMLLLHFLVSSLLLGAVTNGMLFGHWYLVDPHMSLEPLKKLILLFAGALVATIGLFLANALMLDTSRLFGDTAVFHQLLFWMRALFGTVSSLMLAFLTWRCLILGPGMTRYAATRAATGMLYVAMLTAFSGELLGRFLMITTRVPV